MIRISGALYPPPIWNKPGNYFIWSNAPIEPNLEEDWNDFVERLMTCHNIQAKSKHATNMFCVGCCGDKTRSSVNVVSCGIIGWDYDEGDMNPTLPFQRFPENAMLIYSSFNSTPGAPRFRVFIPISRFVSPDEYRAISRHLLEVKFPDFPAWDKCSVEPSRLYFLPATNAAAPSNAFIYKQDGVPIDVDAISKITRSKEEASRILYELRSKKYETAKPKPTIDQVKQLLVRINPADYQSYIRVGWVLKEQYPGEGYDVFSAWAKSQTVKKRRRYTDAGIKEFWKQPSSNRSRKVGIGTLKKLAEQKQ